MQDTIKLTKFQAYQRLMRIDNPIGTLLLLWPTLWALWLSGRTLPPFKVLVVFVLGVIVMRAAGCVINDYADRKVDGHVERTRQRPLPAGLISEREAKGLFVALVLVAFLLVLTMSGMTILLSVGGILLASAYPFMKRYTHLPQVVLGAAFGWAIPMAWMAVSGDLPLSCWLVFLANVCWTVAYDTFYAMVDRNDDLKIGVKSTAILFGKYDCLIIGGLQVATLALLAMTGRLLHLNGWYYLSLLVAGGFFIYQQRLAIGRERQACFRAFLNNNYVGLVIFVGVVLSTLPFINLM